MKNTAIIFLRHGEVHNPGKILYARSPRFKISDNGIIQVKNAIAGLKKYQINRIYSSPLLRTRQTANIISRVFGLDIKISLLLNEVDTIFQGIPLKKYKNFIQPKQYDSHYVKKGSESINEISNRMLKFVSFIKRKHPKELVLAVSHGDPIVILKSVIEGKKFTWNYKIENYLKTADFLVVDVDNLKVIK